MGGELDGTLTGAPSPSTSPPPQGSAAPLCVTPLIDTAPAKKARRAERGRERERERESERGLATADLPGLTGFDCPLLASSSCAYFYTGTSGRGLYGAADFHRMQRG